MCPSPRESLNFSEEMAINKLSSSALKKNITINSNFYFSFHLNFQHLLH